MAKIILWGAIGLVVLGVAVVSVFGEVQAKPCNSSADGTIGLHGCDPTPTPTPTSPPSPAISFYTVISPTVNVPPNFSYQTQAFCKGGDVVVGGGFVFEPVGNNNKSELRITSSAPGGGDYNNMWVVSAYNRDIIEWPLSVWARCADFNP